MKKLLLFSVTAFLFFGANAQNVGIGTNTPAASAQLEISSTNKGLLIPRMPQSIRLGIASPATGLLVYDLTNSGFFYYNGTAWNQVTPPSLWTANSNNIYNNNSGNTGIGTTTPHGRLDVTGAGNTLSTTAFIVKNSNGDTLIRMRDDGRMGIGFNKVDNTTSGGYGRTVNLGGTGVNFYTTNETAFGGAIFPTDTSLVIWSNSGSNNYIAIQPAWGNLGVGTYTPNAKFHVNGSMLLGSNSQFVNPGFALTVYGKQDVDTLYADSTVTNKLVIKNNATAGAFLISDATGNAGWVSGALIETDPQVGTITDTYIPKWSNTSSQLISSSISENATGVGIGASPLAGNRLYVSGNMSISASSNYSYNGSKTKYLTIPASSFQLIPVNGTSSAGLTYALAANNGGGLYVDNGVTGTDAFFDAPLTLPVGATIQAVYLYVRDQSNTAEVSGEVFEYDYTTFTAFPVSTITGTGIATQPGNTTISGLTNVPIVLGKSYYIRFNTKENAVGLRIFGAQVVYTVTQVD